jgi:hypothetical protein
MKLQTTKRPKATSPTEAPPVRLYNAVWMAAYDVMMSMGGSKKLAKRIAVKAATAAHDELLPEMGL